MSDGMRRAMARLDPSDPVRPLVELVIEDPDPVLLSAVARRLLAEIRSLRGAHAVEAAGRQEAAVVRGQPRES